MSRKIFLILPLLVFVLMFASTVTATTSLTYVYDANGNLISGDGKYYEYNDANQLVKVKHGDQNGPVVAEYFYDYTGQRIKKIDNGVTTYYIGKHYETQTDGSNTQNTSYYFANGERVAKKDALGNMAYYHSDHLGGTNVVTDFSGNLVERIKYYPFGEIREGGNDKYSFTGKEKDKQTDFYYFEARYYDSDFKHFTQADLVDPNLYDPQDLNRYAYVRNNPIGLVDPDGRSFVDKMVNYASNTKIGNCLGDKMFNLMVYPGIAHASPETQAAYYSSLADGLAHSYDVTKKASGTALDAVLSLRKGPQGPIGEIYKMSIMLAEETGYFSEFTIDSLYTAGDIFSLGSSISSIRKMGQNFKFQKDTARILRKGLGKQNYYKLLRTINKNKLHDAYKIMKTLNGLGNKLNKNIERH